jgi:hypothetical protein
LRPFDVPPVKKEDSDMPLRPIGCALIVGGLIAGSPALATELLVSDTQNDRSPLAPRYTAEESKAMGAEADRRARKAQRKWDLRLNKISGSICDGC